MADISSLLPPPPPKPSFANRIKIKLEYTDLKAQFYQVANQKESLLGELAEKEAKQLKLRMECDLILDQIELIQSRLPIGYQQVEADDVERKRYHKYQEKTEGFMYESDDQLINQSNSYKMDEEHEDHDDHELEGEGEEGEGREYEDEEDAGDAEAEGEDEEVEEEGQGQEQYDHQGTVLQHDFANQSRPFPPAHHQQIVHQQQQHQGEEREELDEEEDDEEEDHQGEDNDEDEYEDADDQSMAQAPPHLSRPPAPMGYQDSHIS